MTSRRIALALLLPLALTLPAAECLALPQAPAWTADFARPDMDLGPMDLVSFDDGSGPKLYAAGEFTLAGGVVANSVARWNGTRWSALGTGLLEGVGTWRGNALAVYDDGQGPALFVGGSFGRAGGQIAHGIAKWDGTSWHTVGAGMPDAPLAYSQVRGLAVYDDGSGPALYVAGSLTSPGGAPARTLAKWDGNAWSSLSSTTATHYQVVSLHVFDDGSGPALYAGGGFQSIAGVPAKNVARWDGTSWLAMGAGSSESVNSFATYDDGGGPRLYAGGGFGGSGLNTSPLGRWDGSIWSPIGPAIPTHDGILSLEVFDDGSGPRLGIGYWSLGGDAVATWDGTRWSLLPGRFDQAPVTLAVHDDGNGPALYAGGFITRIGGKSVGGIARWDGSNWSSLSQSSGKGGAYARALAVFDDGTGPALFAGGWFDSAGRTKARHVAKWDGAAWSEVGDGPERYVRALVVHDDGSGSALYAGGESIERWDGSSWSSVGTGLYGSIYVLAVFDDGGGPELYAGGNFGLWPASGDHQLAKWDGSTWTSIATANSSYNMVLSLAVFDDGTGPALYAGCDRGHFGGGGPGHLAKWDGSTWSEVGGDVDSGIAAMTVFDDGTGPALYVGGDLISAGGIVVDGVARWDGSAWSAVGAITGSPSRQVRVLTVHDDGTGPSLYAGGWIHRPGESGSRGVVRLDGTQWHVLGLGVNGAVHSLASFDAGSGTDLYAGGYFTMAGRNSSYGIARWKR